MFKTIAHISIVGTFAIGLVTPAKAVDPVTGFVVGYVGSKLADEVWDKTTSKPDVRLLDRRLRELEQNAVLHDEMRDEVAKLRARISKNISRDEFQAMTEHLGRSIGAISVRLDNLEGRVERLEVENEDIKAGTKNASSSTYFVQRAEKCEKNQEMERALANLSIAIKIDAECADAYRLRCNIYARRKAWGVVVADTTEAIGKLKRPDSWFYRQRAIASVHVWRLRPCRLTSFEGHTKSPSIPITDLKSVGDDCARALGNNPVDVEVLCMRGLISTLEGDNINLPFQFAIDNGSEKFQARLTELRKPFYEKALADFNAAINADPRCALAFCGRGVVKTRTGMGKSAIDDYTESIRLDPTQTDAYISRAEITADRPESMISDWNRAHALDPADMNVLWHRAYAYGGRDDRKAIADWLEITKRDPTYQHAYYMLGIVYYNVGDKGNADRYSAIAKEMEKVQRNN